MHFTEFIAPVAAGLQRRVQRELDHVPVPDDAPRRLVAGADPDHVLLIGNGPAIGFGVRSHDLALGGCLARALDSATRRGALVDTVARRGTTVDRAVDLLATARPGRFDAVVVCLGSTDAYGFLPPSRWRSGLEAFLEALQDATAPSTSVVVVANRPLQRPASAQGRAGRMVDAHAARLDRVSAAVCASREGVVLLPAPAAAAPLRRSDDYALLAARIAATLVPLLERTAAARPADSARAMRDAPDSEAPRQAAVDRTGLAAFTGSARVDRMLRSACELFGMDAAAVTLVDRDAVRVLSGAGVERGEVARDAAPCDVAVRRSGASLLDVEDGPVHDAGWRSYAGHPLESPDGYRIGTLCLFDRTPFAAAGLDRVALAQLAGRVESELWAEIGRDGRDAPVPQLH